MASINSTLALTESGQQPASTWMKSQQYASRKVVEEKDSEAVNKEEMLIKSRNMTQGKQMWGAKFY